MITLDPINVGTGPDAGDGESLRDGGIKINANAVKTADFVNGTGLQADGTLPSQGFTESTDPADLQMGDDVNDALNKLEDKIELLNFARILQAATIAPGATTFPSGAQRGYEYFIAGDATIDGVLFRPGDSVVALRDDASTTVYATHWHKVDSTTPSRDAEVVTADPSPSMLKTYICDYAVAGDLVLPDYTSLRPGDSVGIIQRGGVPVTVRAFPGQDLNGVFDNGIVNSGILVDSIDSQWEAVYDGIDWTLARSVARVSQRVGEFFYAKSGNTTQGVLAVTPGTITNGAVQRPRWAAMYPEFVVGNDIVFPADVDGMFFRNLGGNAAAEGVAQADATAANGLRVQTSSNAGGNTFNATTSMFTNTGNVGPAGSVIPQGDSETRPANRAYQLYTIVDDYNAVYDAGSLIPNDAETVLFEGVVGNAGTLSLVGVDLSPYEYLRFELEAITAGGLSYAFSTYRKVSDGLGDVQLWYSDGAASIAAQFDAGGTTATFTYAGAFTVAGNQRVVGIRSQKQAIRAEDVDVNDQTTGGYFDVGTMRMQWGTVSVTADTPETFSFPAPFANTAYALTHSALDTTAGIQLGDTSIGEAVRATNKTVTGFDMDRDDNIDGTLPVDWIAIGVKP